MRQNILSMTVATAMLASCINDDLPAGTPAEIGIAATMENVQGVTRAASALQGAEIYNGDYTAIGIYVWKNGETAATVTAPAYDGYENKQVSAATDAASPGTYKTLTTGTPMYFPVDNSDVDVYLYAPYTASPTQTGMAMDFEVMADQSTDVNYIASDFLYGKATAKYSGATGDDVDKVARVTMYHALSKIILKVVPAEGISIAGFSELKLTGVNRKTTIRMSNAPSAAMTVGSAGTDHLSTATAISGSTDVTVTNAANFSGETAKTSGVAAIIPPQALSSLGISATIGAKTATVSLSGGLSYGDSSTVTSFEPGKQYTITLNVKGAELEVRLIEIEDWTQGNGSGSELNLDNWQ